MYANKLTYLHIKLKSEVFSVKPMLKDLRIFVILNKIKFKNQPFFLLFISFLC